MRRLPDRLHPRDWPALDFSHSGMRRLSQQVRQWNIFQDRSLRAFGSFTEWFSFRPGVKGTFGAIRLVPFTLSKESEPFLMAASDALFLIKFNDPRVWRMIEREVSYVVDTYLTSLGAYSRRERSCEIDFEKFLEADNPDNSPEANRAWRVAKLASTIVHESTHGKLYASGFRYNKATRARIERICVKRQHQFLSRLPKNQYDFTVIAYPFDVKRWEKYWDHRQHNRLRRAVLARIWRDARKNH